MHRAQVQRLSPDLSIDQSSSGELPVLTPASRLWYETIGSVGDESVGRLDAFTEGCEVYRSTVLPTAHALCLVKAATTGQESTKHLHARTGCSCNSKQIYETALTPTESDNCMMDPATVVGTPYLRESTAILRGIWCHCTWTFDCIRIHSLNKSGSGFLDASCNPVPLQVQPKVFLVLSSLST